MSTVVENGKKRVFKSVIFIWDIYSDVHNVLVVFKVVTVFGTFRSVSFGVAFQSSNSFLYGRQLVRGFP